MSKAIAHNSADLITPGTFLLIGFFFFNTILLPSGLLYTTLLTPVFIIFLIQSRRWKPLLWFALLTVPLYFYYDLIGADMNVYLQSYLLFSSAAVFTTWAYHFIWANRASLGYYFQKITIYNSLLTMLAIPILLIPVLNEFFWYFVPIHPAIPTIPRLKLLVYEPSFYSFQLTPVFLYFLVCSIIDKKSQHMTSLLLLGLSLLLSLSFGVMGVLAAALVAVLISHPFSLLSRRRIFLFTVYLTIAAAAATYILLQYFPFNPVFERINMIVAGYDPSANGRTWQAFLLAWRILGETNYLLGAGLGQIKVIGHQIIVEYYNYQGDWADLVRIPNAMAETLASFGLAGAIARIVVQIVLFVHTKVYKNYYRLTLFCFIFIFQFTGSYLTNIYEYLIWLLVFLPVFPQFDKQSIDPGRSQKLSKALS